METKLVLNINNFFTLGLLLFLYSSDYRFYKRYTQACGRQAPPDLWGSYLDPSFPFDVPLPLGAHSNTAGTTQRHA